MSDTPDDKPKTLSAGKLTLNRPVSGGAGGDTVKQSFSHGRSKTVVVETRRVRGADTAAKPAPTAPVAPAAPTAPSSPRAVTPPPKPVGQATRTLSTEEREARMKALRSAGDAAPASPSFKPIMPQVVNFGPTPPPASTAASADTAARPGTQSSGRVSRDELRQRELEELKQIQQTERQQSQSTNPRRSDSGVPGNRGATAAPGRGSTVQRGGFAPASRSADEQQRADMARRAGDSAAAKLTRFTSGEEDTSNNAPRGAQRPTRGGAATRKDQEISTWRSAGRMSMEQALESDATPGRSRSVASMRRRAEKFARKNQNTQPQEKVFRDVVIPEVITVGELANRMAERSADVIKSLMKMGVMATVNQPIDADTAELIVGEFGHRFKRVAESDVETTITSEADAPETLRSRPPVVTVMGHVDHGKTSLLDALRKTNVVSREAGGITQHIGAYQITVASGQKVTFIDTPGHAAFTEMRARGANVTDVVILVVAADDGIMPQTIEAIKHARAAGVPLVVAINKSDLPAANPRRVREMLLQHDVQTEDMGGETQAVEVSAKTGMNLDKLLESVLLQAEVLDLKANPDRAGEGKIVEAKLDKGRGAVATVLVQRGTLRVGDIFVAGSEWGRVRALVNDLGEPVKEAGPATPVEVLGTQAVPQAGDDFLVVESETKAREVAAFRARRKKELAAAAAGRGTLEQMIAAQGSDVKHLAVVIKGDVHGSVEAIKGALEKLTAENEEVKVRVLDASVGAISEADINLAKASGALLIGFNVRASPQARELAKRDMVEIHYHSIIYQIIDEIKAALGGLLSPVVKQNFIGYAEILQVFNITKVGKVAGCRVTEGTVKRGAGVRLLRDNVVIHEGKLKTLKRVKDEVKEVSNGFECGMAFENYDNIQVGDLIECFETTEEARTLSA
jgi:translation initiation factor IF-2